MSSTPSTEAGVLRPWHVFLVFSLIGASVAVLRAQNNSLSNLLLVSVAVVSAGFVGLMTLRTLWPLAATEGDQEATVPRGRARAALEREKLLVLRSIKELEFDRAMGKVADQDFAEMSARLRSRAVGLMKQLDDRPAEYRDAIELEVRARLATRGKAKGSPDTAAVTCAQCGTSNDHDARFCKSCGNKLTA